MPEMNVPELSALQNIDFAFPVTDNIHVLTNRILALATDSTRAEKGSVMLAGKKGELNILAVKDTDPQKIKTYQVKIGEGEGIAGMVASRLEPTLVTDIESDTRFKGKTRDRYKTNSFISCPVVGKNGLLGLININDKKDSEPFTDNELNLVKIIADRSAAAIENAFQLNHMRTQGRELEELNSKLIDCEIARADFISQIAHRLRTPLNSIKGSVYYLKKADKLTRGEQEEFFGIISDESTKLIHVLEGLLDVMDNGDNGELSDKTLIDIIELLNEVLISPSFREKFAKKDLQITLDSREALSDIVGDKTKIRQFFINITEFLISYLENGDSITISIRENDYMEITLKLSRRMPEKICSYFLDRRKPVDYGSHDSMTKLYLARKVAQLHSWNIEMRNVENACYLFIRIPQSTRQKREILVNTAMEMFVEFISELLNLQTCSIMLYDDITGDLIIKSSKGLTDHIVKHTRIKPGDKIAGLVARKGEPFYVKDIESDLSGEHKNLQRYNTHSFISLPLNLKNKTVGVINLSNKNNAEPFSETDFAIASLMSDRISYFIEKFSLSEYDEAYSRQFIQSFEGLLDIQKKYHKKHSTVSDIMMKMLDTLGMSEADKKIALYISMVYDLGLMLVDQNIFLKNELSAGDERSLKLHPYDSVFLLDSLEFSDAIKLAILHHHEKFDGTGYPDGLKREEIPLLSRVLAVVDSFCAMMSERSYRKKFTKEEALKEIMKGSGSLYDPVVVKSLKKLYDMRMV
jgi:HD-GYP domain-containing protein (c-di-GMP phosphodiesterase class II)